MSIKELLLNTLRTVWRSGIGGVPHPEVSRAFSKTRPSLAFLIAATGHEAVQERGSLLGAVMPLPGLATIGVTVLALALIGGCSGNLNTVVGTWITVPPSAPGALPNLYVFSAVNGRITGVLHTPGEIENESLREVTVSRDSIKFNTALSDGFQAWAGRINNNREMELWPTSEPLAVLVPGGYQVRLRRAAPSDLTGLRANTPRSLVTHKMPLPPVRDIPPNDLARTPPMGWNSWNHFRESIDDQTVREIADALVSSGLRDVGYVYLTIDDGWQGRRDAQGYLHPNSKFPDMRGLAEYLHSKGLRFGIYSSPGPVTCASYLGSHGYETKDAQTFAQWGVDYLKYDWCSAPALYPTAGELQALYQKMGEALQASGRPIIYSIATDGLVDVKSWGRRVGGNLWRTSDDIADSWSVMSSNGFEHHGPASLAGPGAWNDPDMLEVGNGGMTDEEYRTHLTLWCMLAAPLILGNDIRSMSRSTKDLLLNKEVISVDQDSMGRQGERVLHSENEEIWTKSLSDGGSAVAIFNRGALAVTAKLRWVDLGLAKRQLVRDLWKHGELGSLDEGFAAKIPAHGSILLRVRAID